MIQILNITALNHRGYNGTKRIKVTGMIGILLLLVRWRRNLIANYSRIQRFK